MDYMEELCIKRKTMKVVIVIMLIAGCVVPVQKIFAAKFSCAATTCPREITIEDNGKVLTYIIDRKFNVVLDRFIYTPQSLSCAGDQVLERTKSLRDLYPAQMERFQVVNSGSCILSTGDFSVTIIALQEVSQ
jgi:hypothetical protein